MREFVYYSIIYEIKFEKAFFQKLGDRRFMGFDRIIGPWHP